MNVENTYESSPSRAPHWRWLRALQIDSGGPKATRLLDGPDGFVWIRRALRLKRHVSRLDNNPNRVRAVLLRDPDLFWAHSMWAADKKPSRWTIEARVLAGETDEEIAEKAGISPGIVNAYVNTFFDVRAKLPHKDYILSVVLADAVTRGLQERQYDLLWKMMAFVGGPYALDTVISRFIDLPKPENAAAVSGFFQDFAINSMKYKAAVAAMTVQVNSHTQLPLIDSFVKYVEIERTTDNATRAHSTIVQNISEMMAALPFRVGTKQDAAAVKIVPFDNGASELRNDELMIINAGGQLSNQDEIRNLNFPSESSNAVTK
jgi:hypothetical protein